MPVKVFDPSLASPFRIEWLVPLDATTEDDYTRAVAEKATQLLRAARFMAAEQGAEPVDLEIRMWVEAAVAAGCVSITFEPGQQAFAFHLLDESLRERLAVIVFDDLPCVDADASIGQEDAILRAALESVRAAEERDALDMAARFREATRPKAATTEPVVRLRVKDAVEFEP